MTGFLVGTGYHKERGTPVRIMKLFSTGVGRPEFFGFEVREWSVAGQKWIACGLSRDIDKAIKIMRCIADDIICQDWRYADNFKREEVI